MTSNKLIAWRQRLGLSQDRAASLMGISRRQYIRYEVGESAIPQLVELACKALES